MTERDVIAATTRPNSARSLQEELEALGVEAGMVLLVHTSLSALGWTIGGAQAVIHALQEVLREYGTLIMPTQSGHLSEPSEWENPPVPREWWPRIREEMPPYDPELTASRGMGAVAECFRTYPRTVRSVHPHYSFTAWGERSVHIATDHRIDFGLGDGSPLAKIYDLDGSVLLLGCGFESNTSFHLAEHRAEYKRKAVVERYAPILVDGHRRWKSFRDVNIDSEDFPALGADFRKHHASDIREGRVGQATALLFRQRPCVDYAESWLHRHRTA